jgi:hypothetical protein
LSHDPTKVVQLAAYRAKGGHNRASGARARKLLAAGMTSLGDVNEVLKLALLDVWKGRLEPKIANAMATLAGRIVELSVGVDLEAQVTQQNRRLVELETVLNQRA